MSDNTELLIAIKTVADTRGLQLTDEQVRKVARSMEELNAAARKPEAAAGLNSVADAAKNMGHGADEATHSARQTGIEMKHLAGLGHEAEAAMHGLEVGGFRGLAIAGANVGRIFATLATGTLGLILLPAIAAASAAILALEKITEHNGEAMKKMWEEAAKRSENYKATVEKNTKELEKYYEAQRKKIEAVTKEYDSLVGAIDRAEQHAKAFANAKREAASADADVSKQKELLGAKSPEERAAIEAKYEAAGIARGARDDKRSSQNDNLTNDLRAEAERKIIRDQSSLIDQSKTPVNKAIRAFQTAHEEADAAGKVNRSLNSDESAKAYGDAVSAEMAAKQRVDEAEKEFYKTAKEAEAVIAASLAKLSDLESAKKVGAVKEGTAEKKTLAAAIPLAQRDSAKEAELRKEAESAQSRGDFASQDRAVHALQQIHAAAKDVNKALGEAAPEIANTLKKAAKSAELLKQKVKNTREGS